MSRSNINSKARSSGAVVWSKPLANTFTVWR